MKKFIEIKTLSNGSHRNQTCTLKTIPEGWAVIPDDMETPNFPFGTIEAKEVDGIMTVTKWTPGVVPEVELEPLPEPTTDIDDFANAILEGVNEV